MFQAVGNPTAIMPPCQATSRYRSAPASQGRMQVRCGGCCTAVNHWLQASSDSPSMPTLPSHQGCTAIHSIMS